MILNRNNYILFYFTKLMKITIDTKEDSHEDIQKVVEILQHFSKKQVSEPVDTTNMMSMFGSDSQTSTPVEQEKPIPQTSEGTPPDFTSFLNLKKEDKENKEGIQFF